MKSNFQKCLNLVLIHEGGYVNHPADPGGATNKGVIQRVYNAYRKRKGQSARSVRHITDAEVRDIYKRQYWDRVEGDDLPYGVDYAVFDYAVNSGTARAENEIQRVLGSVTVDGQIGQVTLAAIEDADPKKLIVDLCNRRMRFLKRLKHWKTFGRGWTRRIDGVRKHALEMVGEQPSTPIPDDPGPITPEKQKGLLAIVTAILKAIFGKD